MGYYKRSNSNITDFKPDDTETTLFLECNYDQYSILDIVNRAKEKWGDSIQLDEIEISSEYIHTRCIGYDCYDPGDYENYLVITYSPKS